MAGLNVALHNRAKPDAYKLNTYEYELGTDKIDMNEKQDVDKHDADKLDEDKDEAVVLVGISSTRLSTKCG